MSNHIIMAVVSGALYNNYSCCGWVASDCALRHLKPTEADQTEETYPVHKLFLAPGCLKWIEIKCYQSLCNQLPDPEGRSYQRFSTY